MLLDCARSFLLFRRRFNDRLQHHFLYLLFEFKVLFEFEHMLIFVKLGMLIKKSFCESMIFLLDSFNFTLSDSEIQRFD